MRHLLCLVLFFALTCALLAQDYLTKDGQLTHELKIIQKQGGFAGFTGFQYTFAPDGSWTSESIFKEKLTPKGKGKMSRDDLEKLGAMLKQFDVAKLPEKAGKATGANPFILTIEYGKTRATYTGQMPPKLDQQNPAASDESRFAGIWKGATGLVK